MPGKHLLRKARILLGLHVARNEMFVREQQLARWQHQLARTELGSPGAHQLEETIRKVSARFREAEDNVSDLEKELAEINSPRKPSPGRRTPQITEDVLLLALSGYAMWKGSEASIAAWTAGHTARSCILLILVVQLFLWSLMKIETIFGDTTKEPPS